MAPIPLENGVDGDDEREEEEDDSEEEEEEEEEVLEGEGEEEEEPRLKYQRMGGSIPTLLSSDAACCIAIAERMIALGTHDGTVHILDLLGNQVIRLIGGQEFDEIFLWFLALCYCNGGLEMKFWCMN